MTLHGKEFIPSEPRGRVTLAYSGKKDLSVESFTRPELVKILDLSHNEIVYPSQTLSMNHLPILVCTLCVLH